MGCSTGHKGLLSYIASFWYDEYEPIEIVVFTPSNKMTTHEAYANCSLCFDVFQKHQEITGLFKKRKKREVFLVGGECQCR